MVLNLVYMLLLVVGAIIVAIDSVADHIIDMTTVKPRLISINRKIEEPSRVETTSILSNYARKQASKSPLLASLKERLSL